MADNKVVAAKVQIDTDAATRDMLKLKGTIQDLKKELKDSAAGSEEQLAAFKKLKAAEEDLAKAQSKLSEANKETGGGFSKIKENLNALPGAAGAAGKSVEGLNAQFKALLANPIGLVLTAIVLALTLLYKAFTNTFEGAKKVEQVFAGIKAAAQALFDNLEHIAKALVKLYTFDFSGAIDEIKGVAKAAGDAYNAMAKLTKEAQELHEEQLANDLDQAERQKKLAILREQAEDDSVPIAKRKAALKELKQAAEENAKSDIDLAKRTAENKIAQLTLEKDGAKKNQDEINQIKIEQIRVETDNANELRRIGKQLTAADKQELAEQKEARQKAAEEEKARRQNLIEFTNKLLKLQQENELALIEDGYLKERIALRNKIEDDKRQNELAYKDKKISLEQLNILNEELENQQSIQLNQLREKHKKEEKAKEEVFQKELADITNKTRIAAIKDTRAAELVQLEIGYQEKLKQAIDKYKDDTDKLEKIKAAIDEQYRTEKAEKEKKYKEEDDKKKLDEQIAAQEQIFNNQKSTIEAKQAALEAEELILADSFNRKVITEEEYGKRTEDLTKKRMQIVELETAHRKAQAEEAASVLTKLSDLVGKKTAVSKVLGIAAATINTFQGASEALKQPSTLPSPFDVIAKITNVATVIAAGLKTVKEIAKVEVPGGGGSGSVSAPSITAPSAPIAPIQTSTSLDQGTINNIGNAAAGGVNGIRAYVVEQDSAAAAARAARLQGAAVLGG